MSSDVHMGGRTLVSMDAQFAISIKVLCSWDLLLVRMYECAVY